MRTFLPLDTGGEVDFVVERKLCNCGFGLSPVCEPQCCRYIVIQLALVYAADHSGEMFATLVWAGGGVELVLDGGVLDAGGVDDGTVEEDAAPGRHCE